MVIGFSGRNLWTKTKYKGADPELNYGGARTTSRNQDFLTVMHPKVFNFFLRLSL